MTHPRARRQELAREARRRLVAGLMLAGVTDLAGLARGIEKETGTVVSHATISRDVAAIEAEWRERVAADVATAKGRDDARLDRLYAAAWPLAAKGNVAAINACVKILIRHAAMWGYDAPMRIEVSHLEAAVREQAAALGLDPIAAVEEVHRIVNEGRLGATP